MTLIATTISEEGGKIKVEKHVNPDLGGSTFELSVTLAECRAVNEKLVAALKNLPMQTRISPYSSKDEWLAYYRRELKRWQIWQEEVAKPAIAAAEGQ